MCVNLSVLQQPWSCRKPNQPNDVHGRSFIYHPQYYSTFTIPHLKQNQKFSPDSTYIMQTWSISAHWAGNQTFSPDSTKIIQTWSISAHWIGSEVKLVTSFKQPIRIEISPAHPERELMNNSRQPHHMLLVPGVEGTEKDDNIISVVIHSHSGRLEITAVFRIRFEMRRRTRGNERGGLV